MGRSNCILLSIALDLDDRADYRLAGDTGCFIDVYNKTSHLPATLLDRLDRPAERHLHCAALTQHLAHLT
jgi:hypothetical protein